jgi:putative lipase involved disintegration of autophagic bodies
MTDFNAVLALLSAAAYREGRSSFEWITKWPTGVDRLPGSLGYVSNTDSGFEASAFLYDGKIVISFAGTADYGDAAADLLLAAGLPSSQLNEAALFYQQVKAWAIAEYGEGYADNIVFTGHSLGGGLAARDH